jgi:hypothetical protein
MRGVSIRALSSSQASSWFGPGAVDIPSRPANPSIEIIAAGGTGTTLASLFPGSVLQPGDVVFWMAFDQSNGCGTLYGTNAVGTELVTGWKGACYAYVPYSSADTGNYYYDSAAQGHKYFALRGLQDADPPFGSSSSVGFYSGDIIVPGVTVPVGGGSLLVMQFTGDGNRDAALTSITGASSFVPIFTPTTYLGAWLTTPYPAGGTGDLTVEPDGTGGGGGDSWAAVLALNGYRSA